MNTWYVTPVIWTYEQVPHNRLTPVIWTYEQVPHNRLSSLPWESTVSDFVLLLYPIPEQLHWAPKISYAKARLCLSMDVQVLGGCLLMVLKNVFMIHPGREWKKLSLSPFFTGSNGFRFNSLSYVLLCSRYSKSFLTIF